MLTNTLKNRIKNFYYKLPENLRNNHKKIDKVKADLIKESIEKNYHSGWRSKDNYPREMYEKDLQAHLFYRLEKDRIKNIPWLNAAKDLKNSIILEIGCGTGASSIALAEQGAKLIGIDVDEDALKVARDRSNYYGLNIEFLYANGNEICKLFSNNDFDFVIFFACLEHMTINERIESLRNAWSLIKTGGLLVIIETPNRLWFHDSHTANLPFYHWLPDELAFQYSKFSPRNNFRELYQNLNDANLLHFLRRGRGASYHEFQLAMHKNVFKVVSSYSTFNRLYYYRNTTHLERKYKSVLMKVYPHLHEGFFDKYLDIIIRKI